jgi:hypothetical protein
MPIANDANTKNKSQKLRRGSSRRSNHEASPPGTEGGQNNLICSSLSGPPCRRLKQLTKSWPHLNPPWLNKLLTYKRSCRSRKQQGFLCHVHVHTAVCFVRMHLLYGNRDKGTKLLISSGKVVTWCWCHCAIDQPSLGALFGPLRPIGGFKLTGLALVRGSSQPAVFTVYF